MTSGPVSVNKVLHLINGEHYAGAERVQDLLCNRLPEYGYEAHLACLKTGAFPERANIPPGQLHLMPMQSRFDFSILRALSRLIRREGFTLIHSHTPRSAMIGALLSLRHGLPLVHHQHSPSTRETLGGFKDRMGAAMETLAVKRATRVIAVSEQIAVYCKQMGFKPERIVLVHNGVPSNPTPRKDTKPETPLRLAVVALFRERKGLEVAFEALARTTAPLELHVIGKFVSADYEARVRAQAASLGITDKVKWRGSTNDVYGAFSQVDGFILPSLYGEGLPMVLLEAMASGLPVFASDVEGVRDALPGATVGTVFPAGASDDLSKALVAYAQNPEPFLAMARLARERHALMFSDTAMAANTAQVYNMVIT